MSIFPLGHSRPRVGLGSYCISAKRSPGFSCCPGPGGASVSLWPCRCGRRTRVPPSSFGRGMGSRTGRSGRGPRTRCRASGVRGGAAGTCCGTSFCMAGSRRSCPERRRRSRRCARRSSGSSPLSCPRFPWLGFLSLKKGTASLQCVPEGCSGRTEPKRRGSERQMKFSQVRKNRNRVLSRSVLWSLDTLGDGAT